ncbi:MAG: hypothetical protein QS748_02950 [Candidatus Endonucleobacter bathymodioli]|uniref:Mitochondria-eating protein C-terminal domain-containing protein n=1 Tax=Candidatus Endonucleibacter bathymodioli TaxID=539814 RepID=A0AA90NPQ1_9GAMM|nr:hypothetical protein [Candidatus Endonucleobacter bathymodioli]
MKITSKTANEISTAISDGLFKIDDKKKAITASLGGRNVVALVLDKQELSNVRYTENNKAAHDLYRAYQKNKKSKPISHRRVKRHDVRRGPLATLFTLFKKAKKALGFDRLDVFNNKTHQTHNLKREIQHLTAQMRAPDLNRTGMGKDANSKNQDGGVIPNMENIKLRSQAALYSNPATGNIIYAKTKTKSAFKETNEKILDLMQRTESLEDRISKLESTYTYPSPNPRSTDIASKMKYWNKRREDASTYLSKISGRKMAEGNPAITDLSDKNRPMKIAERYSELYDNEWTDFMATCQSKTDLTEKKIIALSLQLLMIAKEVCQNNPELTFDNKEAIILKEIKHTVNNLNLPDNDIKPYINKCTNVCTYMLKQSPPMLFGEIPQAGNDFPKNVYREYTTNGSKVDYVVWPPLYLHEGGPLLNKGVAQPIATATQTKTDFKETNETVLQQIKETEMMEARIPTYSDNSVYEYLPPNPGNTGLQTRTNYWTKRLNAAKDEMSRIASIRTHEDNPDIALLDDENRPTLLGERLSGLYDNEWTDALEFITDNNGSLTEEQSTQVLFSSIMTTSDVCRNNKDSTSTDKEEKILKAIMKEFNSINLSGDKIKTYIQKSINICTNMLIQTPPLTFGEIPKKGTDLNKDHYKEFTCSGTKISYMVFPALHLHKNGPLITKGVVQPIKTKK